MIVYKLTDENGITGVACSIPLQWGNNVTHSAAGNVFRLCENGVIHAYRDPILAVLLDPIHGDYGPDAKLWECRIDGRRKILDDGLKIGTRTLTTIREIEKPRITQNQRVYFAILCAKSVLPRGEIPEWDTWADRWIAGTNRTVVAAPATADIWAAIAASWVARTAAWGANAVYAAYVATRAADAYTAAARTADADAWTANGTTWAARAADTNSKIDFVALAHQAAGFEV